MTYALYSCDINSLIYQYMIERGLEHSAFLLKNEAESITEGLVPGSLISYLEKALAMEELETHMNEKVKVI
jgi:LisH